MRAIGFALVILFSSGLWANAPRELSLPNLNHHSEGEWSVDPLEGGKALSYRGQNNSLLDWNSLDTNKWLDFNHWKLQRKNRDETPNWKQVLKDTNHPELVGRVIQCLHRCDIFDRKGVSRAQFGSRIFEGQEFATGEDSYAWILLMDGTLVRVSPESSFTFLEINFSLQSSGTEGEATLRKAFHSIRLNQGHGYFQERRLGSFEKQNRSESDLALYPLLIKRANREHFARLEYQALKDRNKLLYQLEQNQGYVSQYEKLNELLAPKEGGDIETEIFIYSSNASFKIQGPNFHIFHELGDKTWFLAKGEIPGFKSESDRKQQVKALFRGYQNKSNQDLELDEWYAMDKQGRSIASEQAPSWMKYAEVFIKRIPGIHLARELMLRDESSILFSAWSKDFLRERGYRLWDPVKELPARKKFLAEYTRRMETTNLNSIQKVLLSDLRKDKAEESPSGRKYFTEALNRSLFRLKSLHYAEREVVKEKNDIQYYLWILKNAKPFLPAYIR